MAKVQNMDRFNGTFSVIQKDSENFEKYMTKLGVNFILKMAAKISNQIITIDTTDKETIKIVTSSKLKSSSQIYVPNVEKLVQTMDGRSVKQTLKKLNSSDGKLRLVISEVWDKGSAEITHIMNESGQFELILKSGDVECRRVYERT